ncbi:hypothetical protein ES695_10435 [Candidatus Atribacteria bacterium 1244-E10-H5-B2]|nr:MAG: hypothetical protein ES695_10435 [Candidatus Atribacteria bacterium 1244-E10-H5-B2]
MPKKRTRFKKKFNIDYTRLTDELYESICHKVSMEEMLGGYKHLGYFKDMGFDRGYYFMFDKNDPKICRKIWNLHKKAVMERFKTDPKNNAGTRPFLWWISERPENMKVIGSEDFIINSVGCYNGVEIVPEGEEPEIEKYTIYEDQFTYLKRLGLLEGWEIKAFKERFPGFEEERPPGPEKEDMLHDVTYLPKLEDLGIDDLPY